MKMSNYLNEQYGLRPMSICEELEASENVRAIRYGKMKVVDDCNAIIRQAENIVSRAKRIREKDDAELSEYIQGWLDLVHSARIKMDAASEYGFSVGTHSARKTCGKAKLQ